MRLLKGVIAGGIVAADHRPAGLIGGVFSRGMQKVAVEEEHIARIHLNVDNRKTVEDCGNAFLVGGEKNDAITRLAISPKSAVRH